MNLNDFFNQKIGTGPQFSDEQMRTASKRVRRGRELSVEMSLLFLEHEQFKDATPSELLVAHLGCAAAFVRSAAGVMAGSMDKEEARIMYLGAANEVFESIWRVEP